MGIPASAAAGPADTAARLFTEYGPQLYRFCLGRMRSREEAEDAVQSTFLRVYRALDRGEVPEYEAAWLYKIAHNVCLSRREVMGRRSRLETPQDLDEIEWALAAPESHHDELSGLADALSEMPANLRQAVLLREWQGLSYAEVANAMGTTVSAVETLIFRARKHLAAQLDPERSKQKTLAGLLAGLLGRFSLAAPAAKLVAGGALLAVCGAGAGVGVALSAHHARTAATTAGSTAAAVVAASQTSAPQAASPSAPVRGRVVHTAPAKASTPSPAPPASAPPAAASPAPAQPAPSAHAPAVAPFVPLAVSPTTTTPAPLLPPAPAPPPTQLPAVPVNPTVLPPVTVPGVTTPQLVPTPPPLQPPAVSVPTLPAPPPTPAATLPAVPAP